MKTFRFESIWLLSHKEQSARKVTFHPSKNLILGGNHTGKSSLIRSLFETLGASPQGVQDRWDTNTVSVVEFCVNNEHFLALHDHSNRALFDINGNLVIATGDYQEWSDCFAKTTGFNLVFGDTEHSRLSADPSCFFLPFYINQDRSWQSSWDTFKRMQHYRSPHKDILEYFCGLRPHEYYQLRAERDQKRLSLRESEKDRLALKRARARIDQELPLSGPKVESSDFKKEIEHLTLEVTLINAKQEKLRAKSVREEELSSSLKLQIDLATEALSGYDLDMAYLHKKPEEKLVCPTCGSEHNEQFLEYLVFAEDARVLRDMLVQLRKDSCVVHEEHKATQKQIEELEDDYHRISEILDTKRGELDFRQVVESMGAETAFRAFELGDKDIKKDIDSFSGDIFLLDSELAKIVNKKRVREINDHFRQAYAAARKYLHLNPVTTKNLRLTSRPDLSGSGGPRSILAYYAAIWRTCDFTNSVFPVPVAIDSPNQQDQDDFNLSVVLDFIAEQLPANMQLIVGLGKDSGHEYNRTILLDKPYSLMESSIYEEIKKFVDPLTKALFEALLKQDKSSLFSE